MALYPIGNFITTLKNGVNRAFTVKGEVDYTGKDPVYIRKQMSVDPGVTTYVYGTQGSVIIDSVDMSTNESDCRIEIEVLGTDHATKTERLMSLPNNNGTNTSGYSPRSIGAYGGGFFDIVEHNTENNNYHYKSNKALSFPKGVMIEITNGGSSTASVAVVLQGREF